MKRFLIRVAMPIFVVVALCYASSVTGSFHFDDHHSIRDNPSVHSLGQIVEHWINPKASSLIPENTAYRPLLFTIYTLCWAAGAGETWSFHLLKILFHWGVCLAFYCIWKSLWSQPGWLPLRDEEFKFSFLTRTFRFTPHVAALCGALIFAVHPACSECVDYISATSSLQCALFYLWAFYLFLKVRETQNPVQYGTSLFLYFCAVATKEEGITLPVLVLFAEFFLSSQTLSIPDFFRALRRIKGFICAGVLLGGWIYVMHPVEGNLSRGFVTPLSYFMTQWQSYLSYVRLALLPISLNADYATLPVYTSFFELPVILAALGNLGLLAVAWLLRRNYRVLLFSLLWFYITLSPTSSFVVLAEMMNEHRMYLAYVGLFGGFMSFAFACVLRVTQKVGRVSGLEWIYGGVVISLFMGTQLRNQVWATDESLWKDTVAKNPGSGRALNNLALIYMNRKDYKSAIDLLEKCEKNWSTYLYCPLNLGISHLSLGESDGSQEEMKKALLSMNRAYQLNPENVYANFYMGKAAEIASGDCRKAAVYYKAAIRLTGGRHEEAEFRMNECLKKLDHAASNGHEISKTTYSK